MIALDDIDRQLIDALQRDGRASYADLVDGEDCAKAIRAQPEAYPPEGLSYAELLKK